MNRNYLSDNYKKLRYKYDSKSNNKVELFSVNDEILLNSIYITNALSPYLYNKINKMEEIFQENGTFKLFVTSSKESNAFSFKHKKTGNIIMLNSQIIESFTSEELDFVIAHEVAHLLFGHSSLRNDYLKNSSENFYLKLRNQEISADRFAFMLVEDKSKAYKALFKILTGLPDEIISSNIMEYLHQVDKNLGFNTYSLKKTHPSIYVRLKALLMYESSQLYYDFMGYKERAPIGKLRLEDKIREMSLEVDSGIEWRRIDSLISKVALISMNIFKLESLEYNNDIQLLKYSEEVKKLSSVDKINITRGLLKKIKKIGGVSIKYLLIRIHAELSELGVSKKDSEEISEFIKHLI